MSIIFPALIRIYTKENVDIAEYYHSDEQVDIIFQQFQNYTVRLSDDDLKNIKTEVLLVLGDDDPVMTLEEAVRVRNNLPRSDLWVLPNVRDSAHTGRNKQAFIRISKRFLSKRRKRG